MKIGNGRWMRRCVGLVALLVLAPAVLWAGPYEDAGAAYKRGDYKTAMTLLEEARQQTPDNPRIYSAMGRTFRKLGDDNAARDAYTEFVRLDPNLRTLNSSERQAFLSAFQSLGGQMPTGAGIGATGSGEAVNASSIVAALDKESVYVVPSLRGEVDAAQLKKVVADAKPTNAKILVVKQLGGYPTREALAADMAKRLNLDKYDVLIVMTPKGISAYNTRFSSGDMTDILRRANIDTVLAESGPTQAAAVALTAYVNASRSARSTDTNTGTGGTLLVIGGIIGFLFWRHAKAKRLLNEAKAPAEQLRQRVLADLSYVDGYLDLLGTDNDAIQARTLRATAFEKFDTATGLMKTAKRPEDFAAPRRLLEQSANELVECRKAIDRATGGTGVAMGFTEIPDLSTDVQKARQYRKAEELRDAEERRLMQEEIEQIPVQDRGVSFFSGQPMPADQLIPVTIVVQGHRRTVMATPEEAAAIARGETPQIRVFRDPVTNRNVPWYEYRQYDPYRDYYGYGPNIIIFDAPYYAPIYDVTYDYGPAIYDHYGGWGHSGYGWGMPVPSGGYARDESQMPAWGGQDPTPDHAGGMDFFGTQGFSEQGPSFDTSDSGTSWTSSDSSSFDSGSSWSSSDSSDSGSSWSSSDSSDSGSSSSSDW
jgi:tetratricopeptide (TPR) repeat protein